MQRAKAVILAAALFSVGAAYSQGGAHLRIALEDRLDPKPRQMALGVEIAGLCVGLIISWTERLRSVSG